MTPHVMIRTPSLQRQPIRRAAFRDWAGDETRFEREIAEMALAHKVGDDTERAYRRGNALKRRRQLMEAWGRYVGSTSNVIALPRRASL